MSDHDDEHAMAGEEGENEEQLETEEEEEVCYLSLILSAFSPASSLANVFIYFSVLRMYLA